MSICRSVIPIVTLLLSAVFCSCAKTAKDSGDVRSIAIKQSLAVLHSESPVGEITNEEYAVYSALLSRVRFSPKDGKKARLLVIGTETVAPTGEELSTNAGCQQEVPAQEPPPVKGPYLLSDDLRPLVDELFAKNKRSFTLDRKFKLLRDYVLFPAEDFESLGDQVGPFLGFEAFYRKFPGAEGFKQLSRIGFDRKFSRALVYVVSSYTPISVFSTFALLKKERGKWQRVDEYACEIRAGFRLPAP